MLIFDKLKNAQFHNWLIFLLNYQGVKDSLKYIKGKVLDVGCGNKPYIKIIEPVCEEYIGLDRSISLYGTDAVDIIGSADKLSFDDASLDTVVSFQVLEHLSEPEHFIREAYRVLKPDGKLLLTTPFMWGIHEEPYDYYRYTKYGLEYLLKKNGFDIISIIQKGSLWTIFSMFINYSMVRFIPKIFLPLFYPLFIINQILALLLEEPTIKRNIHQVAIYITIAEKKDKNILETS
jgi:SAM-dependent methyltransferase